MRITVSVGATWAPSDAKQHFRAPAILEQALNALEEAKLEGFESVVYHALPIPAHPA